MKLVPLAWKSLLNRRGTALLTLLAIAVSVALLLGVEKIRVNARNSFANTVSGTDLIVGARSGPVQLLLYSVFRIGNATSNISWQSYRQIASLPGIRWTIPISLGDSHRGYRVMGTSIDYFEHYRYADERKLAFSAGKPFAATLHAVLGAEVAENLGYVAGQKIIISHGIGTAGMSDHKDKPFVVSGILARTGTPVDRTVHISLEGIEAMHATWNRLEQGPIRKRGTDFAPSTITAFLVGLDNRLAAFGLQREINNFGGEPLLAIFPGVALQELWEMMGVAERALLAVSILVVAAAMVGLLAVSLAGLNERRREMAILRSVGASYRHIMGLLVVESSILTLLGILFGLVLQMIAVLILQPYLMSKFGLFVSPGLPGPGELKLLSLLLLAGILVGMIPAYRGYRNSLADGLSTKL